MVGTPHNVVLCSESVEVEKDEAASAEDAGVINIRGKNVRRHSAMLRVVADTLKDGGSLQVISSPAMLCFNC